MKLSEFHDLVKTTANRGSTLDTKIPMQVRLAAMRLERNYIFSYMERFKLLQLVQGDRTLDLPSSGLVRGFKFIRLINSDDTYTYLNRTSPAQLQGLTTQRTNSGKLVPAGYWTVSNTRLILTAKPAEALNGEAMWLEYTDWPTELDSTHPLLITAADALLAQTLMYLAAFITRDPRMLEGWKLVRDEAENTLTRSEDEFTYSGEDISMAYVPQ